MSYYGQFYTDMFIETYFPKDYIGKCIEVGAADGITGSNTLYFEKKGWLCLSIEPIRDLYEEVKKIRSLCENVACGEHDIDNQPFTIVTLNDGMQGAISSLMVDERLIKDHSHLISDRTVCNVNVRKLDTILKKYPEFDKIDFISIDTENTEVDVLKGLDINKWKPKLFVIENNYDESFIGEYLQQFGYKKIDRQGVNDFYTND